MSNLKSTNCSKTLPCPRWLGVCIFTHFPDINNSVSTLGPMDNMQTAFELMG